jgi:cation-transporting ATPase I
MKIPGLSSPVANLVAGVTGGAAQVVRAGVQTAAGAAGAVAVLASPVAELVGPVVQSAAQSTGRMLGTSTNGYGRVEPPVRWHSGRRVHFDLDPLLPFPRWHEHAAVVEEPVRRIPGVAKAHVEESLGRLVVELSEGADDSTVLDEVRDVVADVVADLDLTGSASGPLSAPFADPGNPLAILVPLSTAAMDVVALSAAFTGWATRLPAAPQTTRPKRDSSSDTMRG